MVSGWLSHSAFGACLTCPTHTLHFLYPAFFLKYHINSQPPVCFLPAEVMNEKIFNSKGQMNCWGRNFTTYKFVPASWKKMLFAPIRMTSKHATRFTPTMAWFNSLPSSCLNNLFLIPGVLHTNCTFILTIPFPTFSESPFWNDAPSLICNWSRPSQA